ncbi:MAG: hypothetical protein AABZ12_11380 [Planctomycetota bacterium]
MWLSIVKKPKVPDFRGQVLAVQHVERLLRRVSKALDGAGVPYAIIGGNVVAAWVANVDAGAVRATKDVDILLRRSDLEAAAQVLARAEFDLHEVHGVTMFLTRQNPNPKTGVRVLFACERVRESSLHPAPDVTEVVRSQHGFLILDLPALLRMKLDAFRRRDQVHIEDILSVALITAEIEEALPEPLRARLRQIRETE